MSTLSWLEAWHKHRTRPPRCLACGKRIEQSADGVDQWCSLTCRLEYLEAVQVW
jgi:hypothetical protein